MKVIKKGDGRKGWIREEICTGKGNGTEGCGAVLLIEAKDLYRTQNSFCGRDVVKFTTFRCCECGNATDIDNVPCNVPVREKENTNG